MRKIARSTPYARSASVSTAARLGAPHKRRRPPAAPLYRVYQTAVASSTPTAAAIYRAAFVHHPAIAETLP